MENQPTTTEPNVSRKTVYQKTTVQQKTVQPKKPIVSPVSPSSSYKTIIIVLCTAILLWMLLQGGNKREIKDFFRRREHTDKSQSKVDITKDAIKHSHDKIQSTIDNIKDTIKNSYDKVQSTVDNTKDTTKNSYEKTAESTKTTFQNVADKVKHIGENVKSMYDEKMNSMHESTEENKEYLRNKVNEMAEGVKQTTKETIEDVTQSTKETIKDAKQTTKETIESLKGKSQEVFENAKTTSQEVFENAKTVSQETIDKAKEKIAETHNNILQKLEMTSLIDEAYSNLKEFMNPHLKIEEQIPFKAFSGAKAVVFLSVIKGGMGLGGTIGSGIIIARNEIGHWSGPCAIGLVGLDVGLNIGVEKSNHIIILRDDAAIRAFTGKGQFKLGMDASIAVGPTGRDASVGFSVGDKGYSSVFSYSLAKGAYIGFSFEGQVITLRNDCNEDYYGKKVDASKILDGTITAPKNKHLKKIYKIVDEYAARNLVYPEHSTDL